MVSAAATAWLLAIPWIAGAPAEEASTSVKKALAKGDYPWYDPKSDAVKPVWPTDFTWLREWLERWFGRLPGAALFGDLIAVGLAMLVLTILVVVLIELWRRYRPGDDAGRRGTIRGGSTARIEDLPFGVRPETADPWAEALARRARGDHAGAIVCLFAHQLLTLDRLRKVRLVPGRTGRQYIRAIDDRQFRAWVEPTLRLFEAVYYGHHVPSAEAFERVWTLAEAFERHVAAGAGA